MVSFKIKSINHGSKPLFSIVVFLLMVFGASSQNLIVNGDLNGNTTTWSTGYPSWVCFSTDCIANGAGHPFFTFTGVGNCQYADAQDCDGSYGWFANGESIRQNISTTVGVTYVIEFYYSNLSLYNETCTAISTIWSRSWDNDASIQVKVDAVIIATTPPASPSPLPGGNTWDYFSTTFTATATSHWIQFDGILNTFNPPAPFFGLGIDLVGVRLPNDEGSTFGAAYDGIDNDGDGLIDCADPDCAAFCGANNLCNLILPVGLLEFETQCNNGKIDLSWKTASESNNDYFTIERSLDGINFDEIATINGIGNSSQISNYRWVDEKPLTGITYYRLSQTDFDGKSTYLSVRSESCGEVSEISISPNPFKNDFSLFSKYAGNITLVDNMGKVVLEKTIGSGSNSIQVNSVASGVYIAFIVLDNGSREIHKIVKY